MRGVNDSVSTQVALCERLYTARILPYYLHVLDPVQGAAHYATSREQAADIMHGLRTQLPGYLVPRLCRKSPVKKAKHRYLGYKLRTSKETELIKCAI